MEDAAQEGINILLYQVVGGDVAEETISIVYRFGILGVFCVVLVVAVIFLVKFIVAQIKKSDEKDKAHLEADKERDKKYLEMADKFNNTVNKFATNEEAQTIVLKDLKELIMKKL